MKQLTGTDNVFLISEERNTYNHVAMMMIFDATTAPGGKVRFKDILQHFEERIYLDPIFRRRLAKVPFDLDRPYWIEEDHIDVEYHIRHIALPKPGDWRQLMIQVARLHSRPLDRSNPLWEVYVIEGLDNIPKLPAGAFAVFMKFHHASVDGMAGLHLASKLLSPSADTTPSNKKKTIFVDRIPSVLEYAARAVTNAVDRTINASKLSVQLASKFVELGGEQISNFIKHPGQSHPLDKAAAIRAPETRFNHPVSANRVVDGFGIPLSRIKRVRSKVPGATLNDIFLAVAGGAVRKYLESKKELPERSLVALMPMSLRSEASGGGNAVGAATVKVCSDIADPLERLKEAHDAALAAKAAAEKVGPALFTNIMDTLPSALGNLLLNKLFIPTINMTVSNVRGPDQPMYLAGAKAMCFYPVSVPQDGVGLNLTGVSYNRVMWLSVVSCRKMLPDPEFFTACMKEAWDEILTAADALPDPATQPTVEKPEAKPAAKKRSAASAEPEIKPKSASKEKPEAASEN